MFVSAIQQKFHTKHAHSINVKLWTDQGFLNKLIRKMYTHVRPPDPLLWYLIIFHYWLCLYLIEIFIFKNIIMRLWGKLYENLHLWASYNCQWRTCGQWFVFDFQPIKLDKIIQFCEYCKNIYNYLRHTGTVSDKRTGYCKVVRS